MTYGYPIHEGHDPYIDVVDKATNQFAQASLPGAFLVDTLPIRESLIDGPCKESAIDAITVQYLPEWLPGNNWRRKAAQWRQTLLEMADWPFEKSRQLLVTLFSLPIFLLDDLTPTCLKNKGSVISSYTTDLLQAKTELDPEYEHAVKWSAASLYGGKLQTSV